MRNVEQIVEQTRVAAGADFAFVLTRKGRLVTHRAPREMPEIGRARLVRAARPLAGTERIIELTLPREELVPFGGAAPVDVYVGVVAEQAIVCVVMASWAEKRHAAAALEEGMVAIEPLLRRGLASGRRSPADAEPARGSPFVPERAARSIPPPPETTPMVDLRPSLIPEVPAALLGPPSLPEIAVGEAALGRETMVAIRREAVASGSAPEIMVGEAALGRESMVAIDEEGKPRPSSSPEAIRVELVSLTEGEMSEATGRMTLPWVEPPVDAVRAADAARLGRKLAAPRVTIKVEEVDAGELSARKG